MLFLGAGSVITATHHEQDMRNYGGLRKKIPLTFWAMMIGTLAASGVGIPLTTYGFAGFLSKDAVIETAWVGSSYAFWLLVAATIMSSFYSWRLMFMTFFGTSRAHGHDHHGSHGAVHDAHGHYDHHHEPHESPMTMLIPLGILALGAVFSGMLWYKVFFGDVEKMRDWFDMAETSVTHEAAPGATAEETAAAEQGTESAAVEPTATEPTATESVAAEPTALVGVAPRGAIFLGPENEVIDAAHEAPKWVKVSPFVAMLIGLALAWLFYIRDPSLPRRLATQQRPLYLFLLNKWYFDELYDVIFVRPGKWLGNFLWKKGDGNVIDGSLNGVAMGIIPFFTRLAGRAQSGYLFHYAFAMVLGIVVLVTWMTLFGGAK
jgi:NADH-quinone oxidoreductase subunit L